LDKLCGAHEGALLSSRYQGCGLLMIGSETQERIDAHHESSQIRSASGGIREIRRGAERPYPLGSGSRCAFCKPRASSALLESWPGNPEPPKPGRLESKDHRPAIGRSDPRIPRHARISVHDHPPETLSNQSQMFLFERPTSWLFAASGATGALYHRPPGRRMRGRRALTDPPAPCYKPHSSGALKGRKKFTERTSP
jgi:hypothetical protein